MQRSTPADRTVVGDKAADGTYQIMGYGILGATGPTSIATKAFYIAKPRRSIKRHRLFHWQRPVAMALSDLNGAARQVEVFFS